MWKWSAFGSELFAKMCYASQVLVGVTETHKIYKWNFSEVMNRALPTPVMSLQFDQAPTALCITPRSVFYADIQGSLWRFDQKVFSPSLVWKPKKVRKRRGSERDEQSITKMHFQAGYLYCQHMTGTISIWTESGELREQHKGKAEIWEWSISESVCIVSV